MRPALGWTLLSRDAIKKAEAQLKEDTQGVRDEVGFLALHQAYADRFFPGTSVLQTRLRYALFVPWIYEDIRSTSKSGRIERHVEEAEVALTWRLKKSGEGGIIGRRTYPEPSSQPPSMVYWSGLTRWSIVRALGNGYFPSRADVHRAIARAHGTSMKDDDQAPLDEAHLPFAKLPEPPKNWDQKSTRLSFELTGEERKFLRSVLCAVNKAGHEKAQSLLARLADQETRLNEVDDPWAPAVLYAADNEDREALERARKAASLAAVGRAVYAAMVETLREKDGLATPDIHRKNLSVVIAKHKKRSLAVSPDEIEQDAQGLQGSRVINVMSELQQWLRNGKSFMTLHEVMEAAEFDRKKSRARLRRSIPARRRRAEWEASKHALATPLHYRWSNVRQLLIDLRSDPR